MKRTVGNRSLRQGIVAKLVEILELELSLYAATRDAEWQLSCYGLCEDKVLEGQFSSLAGVIDSLLEQVEDEGVSVIQRLTDSRTFTSKIITRRGCYWHLYRLHRQLLSHYDTLTESLSRGISLADFAEQAIAIHTTLGEKLKVFLTQHEQGVSDPAAVTDEPVHLFI